jgi:hypothetical protein
MEHNIMKRIIVWIGLMALLLGTSTAFAQIMLVQPVSTILHTLKTQGYAAVQKVELMNDEYRIAALDSDGHRVNLRINSHSGDVIALDKTDSHIAMLEVVEKIEAIGYTSITFIELKDNHYSIIALGPNGKKAKLQVNATTGEVSKQLF